MLHQFSACLCSFVMAKTSVFGSAIVMDFKTLKSAYNLCIESIQSQPQDSQGYNWKALWKLQVPPRIKSFLWRLARDCLPTRGNLSSRGVPCSITCAVCETGIENAFHLFFTCSHDVLCWKKSNY